MRNRPKFTDPDDRRSYFGRRKGSHWECWTVPGPFMRAKTKRVLIKRLIGLGLAGKTRVLERTEYFGIGGVVTKIKGWKAKP